MPLNEGDVDVLRYIGNTVHRSTSDIWSAMNNLSDKVEEANCTLEQIHEALDDIAIAMTKLAEAKTK